jgi:hypothetical protein
MSTLEPLGGPTIEVMAKATPRRFTVKYKRKIVREADAWKPGASIQSCAHEPGARPAADGSVGSDPSRLWRRAPGAADVRAWEVMSRTTSGVTARWRSSGPRAQAWFQIERAGPPPLGRALFPLPCEHRCALRARPLGHHPARRRALHRRGHPRG